MPAKRTSQSWIPTSWIPTSWIPTSWIPTSRLLTSGISLSWVSVAAIAVLGCGNAAPSPQPASSPAPGPSGDSLVLMTWNVEFLWDGKPPEDGDANFPWKGSPEAAAEHMAEIAEVIRRENPDVINLAEVEGLAALEHFNARYLDGLGYRARLVEGTDTATGQDMGLLSRLEVKTMGRDPRPGRSGSARKAVSKHYMATLDAGPLKLGLVGLHFLARPDRENRRLPREAQADAIRRMARELDGQGRSVIVWGDFNDFDGATPDADGSRPITRVLEWIRGMDPRDPDDDLVNVTERLKPRERYTSERRGRRPRRSAVDHALIAPELAPRLTAVRIPRHDPREVSDHYPIVFELSLAPAP